MKGSCQLKKGYAIFLKNEVLFLKEQKIFIKTIFLTTRTKKWFSELKALKKNISLKTLTHSPGITYLIMWRVWEANHYVKEKKMGQWHQTFLLWRKTADFPNYNFKPNKSIFKLMWPLSPKWCFLYTLDHKFIYVYIIHIYVREDKVSIYWSAIKIKDTNIHFRQKKLFAHKQR